MLRALALTFSVTLASQASAAQATVGGCRLQGASKGTFAFILHGEGSGAAEVVLDDGEPRPATFKPLVRSDGVRVVRIRVQDGRGDLDAGIDLKSGSGTLIIGTGSMPMFCRLAHR